MMIATNVVRDPTTLEIIGSSDWKGMTYGIEPHDSAGLAAHRHACALGQPRLGEHLQR